jgi:hypothetical protein
MNCYCTQYRPLRSLLNSPQTSRKVGAVHSPRKYVNIVLPPSPPERWEPSVTTSGAGSGLVLALLGQDHKSEEEGFLPTFSSPKSSVAGVQHPVHLL